MRIQQISNQNNFKAINQKYYKWAQKEVKGSCGLGEIFFRIEAEVCWKDMLPKDALDTLHAIKKILPNPRTDIDRTIEYVKSYLSPEERDSLT